MDNAQNTMITATPNMAGQRIPEPNMAGMPPNMGGAPGGMPGMMAGGQPNIATPPVKDPHDVAGLVKTIVIVVLSLIAVTFIGLFIWMMVRYNEVSEDVDGQISEAVASAVYENSVRLEADFAEREKSPYRTFTGPADYGQISFKYPKTWSVYVEADASKGGDFKSFFNPIQVDTVSNDTINALRFSVRDVAFETVAEEYQRVMERQDAGLSVEAITVSGVSANLYTGKIPDSELEGYIVIFKIRDKTAVFQTDSMTFKSDFDAVLQSVTFNA